METLAEVAEALRALRAETGLTQEQLAKRASVPRVTLARMETASRGDMSVATLLRLLGAAGHEMAFKRHAGHSRTLEDILAEQRKGGKTEK
ncbi:MAG TPA: helix-turn-helix transcriptional regulator [Caldimonas sp.]|jgi:transcriptional regulator with XRE-family HTH domain|nr:helix-turn-helix transcriptional regulator [Caldimonas sp.]HEX2542953.1 helix-turn-helix transcriptional regulator [Caldimonas sp.]